MLNFVVLLDLPRLTWILITIVSIAQAFSEQKDLLEEDIEKSDNSMTMAVVICGKNFFNQRLSVEKQQGGGGSLVLNRDMQPGVLDLGSMMVLNKKLRIW